MNFSAYLASSSSDSEGEGGHGGIKKREKISEYKVRGHVILLILGMDLES